MGNHEFLFRRIISFPFHVSHYVFPFYVPENFALHQKFQYGLITMASMYQWIRFVYNADTIEQKLDTGFFALPSLLPMNGGYSFMLPTH